MRQRKRVAFRPSRQLSERPSDLSKAPHLDLANALAADIEFRRQLFERQGVVNQAARGEDTALAVVKAIHCRFENSRRAIHFLALDEHCLLIGAFVDEPILPLAAFRVGAKVAFSEASPPSRRSIETTSSSGNRDWWRSASPDRARSPSSSACNWLFALRRLKKSFFWLAVVPI